MKNLKTVLLGIAFAGGVFTAAAIPPMLGTMTVEQPDGTELKVRLSGNGELHFTLTEDGRLLTQDDDGYYRLAKIDTEGNLISTGLLPGTPGQGTKLSDIDVKDFREKRDARQYAAPMQSGLGLMWDSYPTTGSPRVPVFLVEYSDVKFHVGYNPKTYFEDLFNGSDFHENGSTGSVKQYFKDQSGGKFTPQFDVYGPITLPENRKYYGGNSSGGEAFAHYMVSHAAKILDPTVDFSVYDLDKDGDVDFVYVIYAGEGEHRTGQAEMVYPHAGMLKQRADFIRLDGKYFNRYACSNELGSGKMEGMGAILHEYSHILGLPDLYSTDVYNFHRNTPGPYSLLDYGVYNNDGYNPPNYTAYEINALKWAQAKEVVTSPTQVTLNAGEFIMIPTKKTTEFFLIENRQLQGWDIALPYHGMLVWHIDYVKSKFSDNEVSNDINHLYVDLVEANGVPGFAKDGALFISNLQAWPFPGIENITAFTAETTPAFRAWDGSDLGLPITNIKEKDGVITFNVAMESDEPDEPEEPGENPEDPGEEPGEDPGDNPDDPGDNPEIEESLEISEIDGMTVCVVDHEAKTLSVVTAEEETVSLLLTAPEGTVNVYYLDIPEEGGNKGYGAPAGYRQAADNGDGTYSISLATGTRGTIDIQCEKEDNSVKAFTYTYEVKYDESTGIVSIDGATPGMAVYFNLQGQRVAHPEHGVFIKVVNGKAVKVVL